MATVFSSNRSSVLLDGEAIEGLQSLAFRVVTEQESVRAVGTDERVAVVFGLRVVQGEIAIRSTSVKLDAHLKDRSSFQLMANLKQDDSAASPKRTLSFDECYAINKEVGFAAGGSILTTYVFTATRLREE